MILKIRKGTMITRKKSLILNWKKRKMIKSLKDSALRVEVSKASTRSYQNSQWYHLCSPELISVIVKFALLRRCLASVFFLHCMTLFLPRVCSSNLFGYISMLGRIILMYYASTNFRWQTNDMVFFSLIDLTKILSQLSVLPALCNPLQKIEQGPKMQIGFKDFASKYKQVILKFQQQLTQFLQQRKRESSLSTAH